MPFDPSLPAPHAPLASVVMRDQFNALAAAMAGTSSDSNAGAGSAVEGGGR